MMGLTDILAIFLGVFIGTCIYHGLVYGAKALWRKIK